MKTILMLPGAVFFIVCVFFFSPPAWAALSRADWGAPQVAVSESGGTWTIAGQKQVVRLDARTLALDIHAQGVDWRLFPSGTNDMIVKFHGRKFHMALADARDISIQPYDTGFKTGVKVTLSGFQHEGQDLDLTLYLTVCLQGANEELVFDTAATEGQAA
ncbi:MAG: hypothetical protein KGR98_05525, partial [Verrucomicrobia bacterium]|nr:hypothetical protein [Verrucomicrobiota bacterium]